MSTLTMAIGKLFVLVMIASAIGCVAGEEAEPGLDVTDDDMAADDAFAQSAGDGKEDSGLTYVAVARLVKAANVPCTGDRIALAVAIARAESSFRPWITNTEGNTHGTDRGLFQLNDYWHPEVSDACSFSASCNTRAAARVSKYSTKWSEWWTYNNGKHLPYMAQARGAQGIVCAE